MLHRVPFFFPVLFLLSVLSGVLGEETKPDVNDSYRQLFEDILCTVLKKEVTEKDLDKVGHPAWKKLAEGLYHKKHDLKQRVGKYEAFPETATVAARLKVGEYDAYENATGIFFAEGDYALVIVDSPKDSPLFLTVRDFGPDGNNREESYSLEPGVNVIESMNRGLSYISYYSDEKDPPAVRIHISGGRINGVFRWERGICKDQEENQEKDQQWKDLLKNTVCPVIDLVGERVHLVFSVKGLREHCPQKGRELLEVYDMIVKMEHDLMGLDKYGLKPPNRMMGRTIWGDAYMFADEHGAAFHEDTMETVANPEKILKNSWGIVHEFGHVNQLTPGMDWPGTSEVTNNIFSTWINYEFNPSQSRLETEECDAGDGNGAIARGRMNAFLESALVRKEPWLFQQGIVDEDDEDDESDPFVALVPLWQLQLYYAAADMGNKDFYPDLAQLLREADDSSFTPGELQVNFMKKACDVARENLAPFFEKAGLLVPVDRDVRDYNEGRLTIAEVQCKELKEYASQYPEPKSPVIYYMNARNVDTYKNKLPLSGETGQGTEEKGTQLIIDHGIWKNAVAYEAYKDEELIGVTMSGTGSKNGGHTLVPLRDGMTRLDAVSWEGKRKTVWNFESRN